jgi:thioredoxin 1
MAKKSFSELLKSSETPVLVDFYADWCGPCKMMSPWLQEYAKETNGKLKIIKINVDKNQAASQAYSVRGVPTLILFKNGKNVWRQSGALNVAQLRQAIGPHLN